MGFVIGLTLCCAIAPPLRLHAELPLARLSSVFPPGGKAGTTVEVTVSGADLEDVRQIHFSHTNITSKPKLAEKTGEPEPNRFLIHIGADVPPATYEARVIGRFGVSNPRAFVVGDLTEIISPATNHSPESATEVAPGTVVNGRADPNAADYFAFTARKGQRILVECLARDIDSRMDDMLLLYDATGRELERQRRGGLLDFIAPANGRFVLAVNDLLYRGGEEYGYRLTLGAGPHLDFIFPPSGLPGTTAAYVVYGRNLPGGAPAKGLSIDGKPLEQLTVKISLPALIAGQAARLPPDSQTAERLVSESPPLALALKPASAVVDGIEYRLDSPPGVSNPVLLSFANAPVVTEQEPNDQPGQAQKVNLPCEFVGQFYPAADRDWIAFEAKKGEIIWIEIFSHRLGLPTAPFALLQRVTRNEKGEEQSADVHELYPSDANIGGPDFNTTTRDPSWRFEVSENGTYRIRVSDLFNRNEDNPRFVYRLSLRSEKPDFRLVALPQPPPPLNKDSKEAPLWTPLLRRGETIPLKVLAFRRENFNGEIELGVEGLPPGVRCAPATIETNKNSALLLLTAAPDATTWYGPLTVMGKSKVADHDLVREARAASISWTVPDYNNESVRARLTRSLFLAVSGAESAPITIEPAEVKIWEVPAGAKLQVPLQLARHGDYNENLKLKALGIAALDSLKELEIDGKTNSAALELDLAQQKLPAGTHTFYLQAQTKGKYRNNPEAAVESEQAAKQAEKLAADLATEAKKAAESLATASRAAEEAVAQARLAAEKFAAAQVATQKASSDADLLAACDAAQAESEAAAEVEKAAAAARAAAATAADETAARAREAEEKKGPAAERAKAANEHAKPREVTVTVYSTPITIRVKAPPTPPASQ